MSAEVLSGSVDAFADAAAEPRARRRSRSTIGRKLAVVVAVATTIGFVLMVSIQLRDHHDDLYELETEHNVTVTTFLAREIAAATRANDIASIEAVYRRYATDERWSATPSMIVQWPASMLASFAVLDYGGRAIVDFRGEKLKPFVLSDDMIARIRSQPIDGKFSEMTANHHVVAVPIVGGEGDELKARIGTLVIAWSLQRVDGQVLHALTAQSALAVLILIGLVALVVFLLNRIVTIPLGKIWEAMHAQKSGDMDARAPALGRDEIGEVALSLNEMLDAIAERDELKRSNEELEQFAYVASHDLQEPLRMVASYCQLLQRRYEGRLDADADEFIGYAVDGANRMQNLINDLLTYSRVGTKGKTFQPTPFAKVLDIALLNLRAAIEDSGAEVTSDTLPTVRGDEGQLVQLLQNLVGNAIKFGKPGATPRVHVGARRQEHQWVFSVRDDGIGFEPEYGDRIFMIFKRLHGAKEYSGTGIGLAICKKIVERHGGRIWVDSAPNEGSTFSFTLSA